jgi:hypothetical protein
VRRSWIMAGGDRSTELRRHCRHSDGPRRPEPRRSACPRQAAWIQYHRSRLFLIPSGPAGTAVDEPRILRHAGCGRLSEVGAVYLPDTLSSRSVLPSRSSSASRERPTSLCGRPPSLHFCHSPAPSATSRAIAPVYLLLPLPPLTSASTTVGLSTAEPTTRASGPLSITNQRTDRSYDMEDHHTSGRETYAARVAAARGRRADPQRPNESIGHPIHPGLRSTTYGYVWRCRRHQLRQLKARPSAGVSPAQGPNQDINSLLSGAASGPA